MDKQIAIKSLEELPQNFELEELFEKLILLEKIEAGRTDFQKGQVYSHQQAHEKLGKWLK